MRLNFPIAALLPVLVTLAPARASQTHSVSLTPGSPVEVSVESFHDYKPQSGFMPIRVTLRNDGDSARGYTLSYAPEWRHGGGTESVKGEFSLSVGPGGRASAVVYAPVVPAQHTVDTAFQLNGPGIRNGHFSIDFRRNAYGGRGDGFPGMGETFAARHVGALEAELKSSGGYHGNLPVTKVGPAFAPADRRAYDGFATLWFYGTEWAALEPAAQSAIREWVALGGNLHLVSESADESVESLGFGEIRRIARGGDEKAFNKRVAERLRSSQTAAMKMSEGEQNLIGAFASALESRPVLLIVLLLAFGLIVGPLNLFVFAKPPHRHRLLWTTPLIAVVSALLMMVFILLADGTGGAGRRFGLGVLVPEQKRIALWQQQVSRSGLLLGSDFDFEPTAQLVPIRDNSAGTSGDACDYEKTPAGWGGEWFTSRAVQAHAVLDTVASRGGVRVVYPENGRPGSVVSSLDAPLASVLVIAPDGSAYTASNLIPGVARPLVAADKAKASAEWSASLKDAGDSLRSAASTFSGRPGRFYASVAKPDALLRPTLDSIRWTGDVLLLTGPLETQN